MDTERPSDHGAAPPTRPSDRDGDRDSDRDRGFAGREVGAGRGPGAGWRADSRHLRSAALLDLVPQLGEELSAEDWTEARARSLVQVEPYAEGAWTPHVTRRTGRPATGLLIATGLLVREVEVAGRVFAELLGEGDLIYPWAPRTEASLPEGRWRALIAGELAVIDEALIGRLAQYPAVAGGLARLGTMRGRFLAVLAVTRRLRRVEDRLILLFGLLAERWGRVTPAGVVVRLPLSHELLARLVGTRRQAVTTALRGLREQGLIVQVRREWRLSPEAVAVDAQRLPSRLGASAAAAAQPWS